MFKGLASGAALLLATVLPVYASAQTIEDALANVNDGLEACIRSQYPDTTALINTVTTLECVEQTSSPVITLLNIDQFSALQSLTVRLQDLGLSSSLDSVANLSALTALDLSFNEIPDISDLAGMTALTELRVAGNSLSDDIADTLQTLTGLEVLDLQGNAITSIGAGPGSGVAALTNLRELYISDNQIEALPSLQGLDALTTIQASRNLLDTAGIATLAGLVDGGGSTDSTLVSLNLALNQIDSIDVVESLVGLRNLIVSDNLLTDIDAVAALDALETLGIENFDPAAPNNSVTSLSPLASTGPGDPLELLFASGNQIDSASGLFSKPNLQLVFLDNNAIRDISAFEGGQLPALIELDLSENFVQSFYFELKALPESSAILLFDNPLLCAEIDIYFGGGAAEFQPLALLDQTSPTNVNTVCSEDPDNDGFGDFRASLAGLFPPEVFDQFSSDPSASVDTDSDGAPDAFNPGRTAADSNSTPPLFVDAFPRDPAASVDSDGDGAPDAFNDGKTAGDSTSEPRLYIDAFPSDVAASIDDDSDGCPFPWNPGRGPGDSTSTPPLILDALPEDPADCIDEDGDGIGPSRELTAGTTDDNPDFDDDGLLDGEEVLEFLTSPTNPDTDNDEFSDFDEVDFGTNPLDADDQPLFGLNIPLVIKAVERGEASAP